MFNLMKAKKTAKKSSTLIVFLTIILSTFHCASALAGSQSVIIGKFKVIIAKCDGESFLWKKQDKIVSTGDILLVKGDYVADDAEGDCRFEDSYKKVRKDLNVKENQVEETYELKAVERKVYCFDRAIASGEDSDKNKVSPADESLGKMSLTKKGHSISMKISEEELCEGEVTLELAHDRY